MNAVDVVVGILIVAAALRGWFRGFFRELFGLLALGAAIIAAFEWAPQASELLIDLIPSPDFLRDGIAFVGVFVVTNLAVNLFGLLLDRLASALLLGGVNRLVGAFFGGAKAAVVAAVVLLFIHLFSPLESLDERVMSSKVGKPLISVASSVLQFGLVPPTEEKK